MAYATVIAAEAYVYVASHLPYVCTDVTWRETAPQMVAEKVGAMTASVVARPSMPQRHRFSWLLPAIGSVWRAMPRFILRDQASISPNTSPASALGEKLTTSHSTAVNTEKRDPATLVDALYQQHSRMVLGYLYRRLPNLADAEDVLADVFLAALHHCVSGDEPGPGWLLLVARRRVADFYRERQHTHGAVEPPQGIALTDIADTRPQPEDAAIRAEEQREIAALITHLPEEQREALALRFGAGLRSPQIAEALGKSDEAVRALLSRAIRRLRKEWAR